MTFNEIYPHSRSGLISICETCKLHLAPLNDDNDCVGNEINGIFFFATLSSEKFFIAPTPKLGNIFSLQRDECENEN